MNARKLGAVSAVLLATTALSGMALAADPVDYAHDWSGFYVGAHAGYGGADVSGQYDIDGAGPGDTFAVEGEGPFDLNLDGFIGGVQAGVNWQSGNFVLGVEGDVSFTDWSDSIIPTNDTNERVSAKTDFVGTLRGRAGYAMDKVLVFATAGVALTDTTFTADDDIGSPGSDVGSVDFNDIGLVVGAGAEYAFDESWSIKAEALYFKFGDREDTGNLTSDSEVGDFAELEDAWMVRLGVNFHF